MFALVLKRTYLQFLWTLSDSVFLRGHRIEYSLPLIFAFKFMLVQILNCLYMHFNVAFYHITNSYAISRHKLPFPLLWAVQLLYYHILRVAHCQLLFSLSTAVVGSTFSNSTNQNQISLKTLYCFAKFIRKCR